MRYVRTYQSDAGGLGVALYEFCGTFTTFNSVRDTPIIGLSPSQTVFPFAIAEAGIIIARIPVIKSIRINLKFVFMFISSLYVEYSVTMPLTWRRRWRPISMPSPA